MNIYIPIEIKARELEGRLLLALTAAERGHETLLGSKGDTVALASANKLRPGIVHHKSISPGQTEELEKLEAGGYVVTCQDEEHGLLREDFTDFLTKRFTAETMQRCHALFAWGNHDATATQARFLTDGDRVYATGSPRVDLWRPEMVDFYSGHVNGTVRPYVLFVANQGALAENSFWLRLDAARYWSGVTEEQEEAIYHRASWEMELLWKLVCAIRRVARQHSDLTIVVRPHPIQSELAWPSLLGSLPNVVITKEHSLSTWIRHAAVVIHEGCTSGFEAAICGTPVIAYEPIPHWSSRPVSNICSHSATDEDQLLAMIRQCVAGEPLQRSDADQKAVDDLLAHRFANLTGPLAADRIVDEWEKLADPRLEEPNDWDAVFPGLKETDPAKRGIQPARGLKRVLRGLRNRLRSGSAVSETRPQENREAKESLTPAWVQKFQTAHKFPPIVDGEMEELVNRFRTTLGRFDKVIFRRLTPRCFVFSRESAR